MKNNYSIALIFTPLVNTGFGNYYPSLASLAGYLQREDFPTLQIDLNEEMVLSLISKESLEKFKEGNFIPGEKNFPQRSRPVLAARILSNQKSLLFNDEGKHAFNEFGHGPAYLLKDLASPFHINFTVDQLLQSIKESWNVREWYRSFYLQQNLSDQIKDIPIIGLSVAMGPQLAPAIFLAELINELFPEKKIIFGGPSISLLDNQDLSKVIAGMPFIDAFVKYDGEIPLLKLLEDFKNGIWSPQTIPGVACLKNGEVIINKPEPGLNMRNVAWAHYDKKLIDRLAKPELGIQLTRGCYWGECSYCDFIELYEGSPAFRTRLAGDFVDEIEYQIKHHNINQFSFITEAIPPGFAKRFSELIIQRNLKIQWSSFAMVDARFKKEHFDLMVKSGCESLVIGVETNIDRVLSLVKKQAGGADNIDFIKKASDAGIRLIVNLIPDLPTTTFDEAMEALEEFKLLTQYIDVFAIFPFEATRSSEVGRKPETFGLKVKQLVGEEKDTGQAEYASNHLQIFDDAMSNEERALVHKAYREFAIENGNETNTYGTEEHTASSAYYYNQDHLDILVDEDGCQVFNWYLKSAWNISPGLLKLIRLFEQKKGMTVTETYFCDQFGEKVGKHLFQELLAHGILINATN